MTAPVTGGSDAMVAYQRDRRAAVIAAVNAALLEMEGEIKAGKQVKACRAEVCRRAGVGESTLKNPSHVETRASVAAGLARLERLGTGTQAPARKAQGACDHDARVDLAKILAIQLDAAMREIACLKAEAAKRDLEDARRHEAAPPKEGGPTPSLAVAA